MFEQFPKEIEQKRKALYPIAKQAKKEKKKVLLVRDNLYVDGKLHTFHSPSYENQKESSTCNGDVRYCSSPLYENNFHINTVTAMSSDSEVNSLSSSYNSNVSQNSRQIKPALWFEFVYLQINELVWIYRESVKTFLNNPIHEY